MALPRLIFLAMLSLAFAGFAVARNSLPTEAAQAIRTGDFAQAHRLLAPLGRQGNKDALYQIGRMFERGLGVSKSSAKAFDYYRRAADQGHIEAAYLVGSAYEQGGSVESDLVQARRWYQLAAAAGHQRAENKVQALGSDQGSPGRVAVLAASADSLAAAVHGCDAKSLQQMLDGLTRRDRVRLSGQTPLALHNAVDCPPLSVLELLVDSGWPLDNTDGAGNTPLHLAVARGEAGKVSNLLRWGASALIENDAGWTPGMLAQRSSDESLKKLLGVEVAKTSVTIATLRSAQRSPVYKGWSLLSIAAWKGDSELVQIAMDAGEQVNAVDAAGRSALYRAIECDHVNVVEQLLGAGANASDPSLLRLALDRQQSQIAQLLIRQGADLDAPAPNGETPLHRAVRNGDQATVLALLSEGGLNVNAAVNGDETALILAARAGRLDLVRDLISNGADVNLGDSTNCAALCWAIKGRHERIAQTLILNNADNLPDNSNSTPLMLAAQAGYAKSVQLLVERGAEVNAQSKSGSHALLLASAEGHADVVGYLMDQGGEIDLPNVTGDTALIAAVRNNHKAAARKLLELGASTNARNNRLENAKTLAQAKSDADWVSMIEGRSMWNLVSGGL
jgi:ankyrin repeat protein